MDLGGLLSIALGAILINNFVLARFLGLCPFLGVSKQLDSALGIGFAVIFVMTLASVACFGIYSFILVPLHVEYLRTIAFLLVITSLVQFVEMLIERSSPGLYRGLGIYLPLVTTNCAVLGVAVLNVEKSYSFTATTIHGFAGGVGFALVLVLMAGLRERLDLGPVPESLRGFPLTLIVTGLMAMAFLGFSGMIGQ